MGIKYNIISGVFASLASVFSIDIYNYCLGKVGFNFSSDGTIESNLLP